MATADLSISLSQMKILLTPMATMAETSGSMTRVRALALEAQARGHHVATCAGVDANYRPLPDVVNYAAPVPTPFRLPLRLSRKAFRIAKRLGIQQRIRISSFEQVLYLIGALEKRYFGLDVNCVQKAIDAYHPDVLVAEHRISPLVAARLSGVNAVALYSAPIHRSRRADNYGRYSHGVAAFITALGLPRITSVLEIYDWAAVRIVPSSPDLEPLESAHIVHVGPLIEHFRLGTPAAGNNIIAYVGNGTLSARKLRRVLRETLHSLPCRAYIATQELRPSEDGNITVAPRFDFHRLLPDALVFISHGGQNSMMESLLHGVPLILFPGRIFERQYNAASVVALGAGIQLNESECTSKNLYQAISAIQRDSRYREKAYEAGCTFAGLGGAAKAIDVLESLCEHAL